MPDLPTTWTELVREGVLQPGHVASSFVRGTADPVENAVSADREVWLRSFYEEKNSIKSMNTYRKITLGKYRALREKGVPKAIPTMCVLTIKRDEALLPVRAGTRLVKVGTLCSSAPRRIPLVPGQHDRGCAAPAEAGQLQECIFQSELPEDEVTIVRLPIGIRLPPSTSSGC